MRSLYRFAGARVWGAFALVLGGALLEGVGILAIVPFIMIFFEEGSTKFGTQVLGLMSTVGLQTREARIALLIGLFLTLLAVRGYVGWLRDVTLQRLSLGFVDHWRVRLFSALATAGWPTLVALRRSDIEHSATTDISRLAVGTTQLLTSSAGIAIIVAQLLVLMILSPPLLGAVLLILSLSAITALPPMQRARRLGGHLTVAGRNMHQLLGQFLLGLKLAKLGNNETRLLARFDATLANLRQHLVGFVSAQAATRGWFQFFAGATVCAALLFGLLVLDTPPASLLVTLLVLARLVGPLLQLTQSIQGYANMLPAFGSLQQLVDSLATTAPKERSLSAARPVRRSGPASLELKGICFRHSAEQDWLLDHVCMTVEAGAHVGLTGPSGTGKTSLLDIVATLLEPSSGQVLVDGRILSDEAIKAAWRDDIAYLTQDSFLFAGTIRENLLWERPDRDEAEIWRALDIASAAAFVRSAPNGLDQRVGDGGAAVSGGERQRLCLARALLRRPRLLILDEATNALDRDTEAAVLGRLRDLRHDMSLLIVSHRPQSLAESGHTYHLEAGRLR